MTVEHTVWCGACEKWAQYPGTKPEVKKQAIREGWSFTTKYGWRCRRHRAEQQHAAPKGDDHE